ncbi:hypothetical protein GF322_05165 [Candidatus Dependentiae bacterium]|nr:hypothetical protein [Candidatus Dependentiae bacterium]
MEQIKKGRYDIINDPSELDKLDKPFKKKLEIQNKTLNENQAKQEKELNQLKRDLEEANLKAHKLANQVIDSNYKGREEIKEEMKKEDKK